MKARVRLPQSCAALFFIDGEKSALIEKSLASAGISVMVPPRENYGGKIGSLLKLPGYAETAVPAPEDIISEELIIFSNIDRKALDRGLDALRRDNLSVRFKAVITEYNKDFTLPELLSHMADEEKNLKSNRQEQ
ncbi:MAG: DUF3783 domain-containing protein [Oscillospiraceae bacterium]